MKQNKTTVLLDSEEKQDRQSAATFLHQLADKIASGTVVLHHGDTEVTLALPANLEVEVKVEQKEKATYTSQKLEIELSWREGDTAVDNTLTLG